MTKYILSNISPELRRQRERLIFYMDGSRWGHRCAFWYHQIWMTPGEDTDVHFDITRYGWLRVRALRCVLIYIKNLLSLLLLSSFFFSIYLKKFYSLSYKTRSGYCDCELIYKYFVLYQDYCYSMYTDKLLMLLQSCVWSWMFAAPHLIPCECILFFTWCMAVKIFIDWLMYMTRIYSMASKKKPPRFFFFSWLDKLIITDVLDCLCKYKRTASWLFM